MALPTHEGLLRATDSQGLLYQLAQSLLLADNLHEKDVCHLLDTYEQAFDWCRAPISEQQTVCQTLLDIIGCYAYTAESIVQKLVRRLCHLEDVESHANENPDAAITLGSFSFASKSQLKQQVVAILKNTPLDVDLTAKEFELLLQVLKLDPMYQKWAATCCRISVAMYEENHAQPIRSFFAYSTDGSYVLFSHLHCIQQVVTSTDRACQEIVSTLKKIVEMVPACSDILMDTLKEYYPPIRMSVDTHVRYCKALLWICNNMPHVRAKVLRILISKLVAFDVAVKSMNPNQIDVDTMNDWKKERIRKIAADLESGAIDAKATADMMGQPDWLEKLYLQHLSEEDIDHAVQILDATLSLILPFLKDQCSSNEFLKIEQNSKDDIYEKNVNQFEGTSDSSETASYLRADAIVEELLFIFIEVVLPAFGIKHVQFIFFYMASLKLAYTEAFLSSLFRVLFDSEGSIFERWSSAMFISSFLSEATFLPASTCNFSIIYFLQFLNEYLDFWEATKRRAVSKELEKQHISERCMMKSESTNFKLGSRLHLFYSVCQSILYITYRAFNLKENSGGLDFLFTGSENFVDVLKSDFCPLNHCDLRIIWYFFRETYDQTGFGAVANLFSEKELRLRAANISCLEDPLASIYPFQTFFLRNSNRYIKGLCKNERNTYEDCGTIDISSMLVESQKAQNAAYGKNIETKLELQPKNLSNTNSDMSLLQTALPLESQLFISSTTTSVDDQLNGDISQLESDPIGIEPLAILSDEVSETDVVMTDQNKKSTHQDCGNDKMNVEFDSPLTKKLIHSNNLHSVETDQIIENHSNIETNPDVFKVTQPSSFVTVPSEMTANMKNDVIDSKKTVHPAEQRNLNDAKIVKESSQNISSSVGNYLKSNSSKNDTVSKLSYFNPTTASNGDFFHRQYPMITTTVIAPHQNLSDIDELGDLELANSSIKVWSEHLPKRMRSALDTLLSSDAYLAVNNVENKNFQNVSNNFKSRLLKNDNAALSPLQNGHISYGFFSPTYNSATTSLDEHLLAQFESDQKMCLPPLLNNDHYTMSSMKTQYQNKSNVTVPNSTHQKMSTSDTALFNCSSVSPARQTKNELQIHSAVDHDHPKYKIKKRRNSDLDNKSLNYQSVITRQSPKLDCIHFSDKDSHVNSDSLHITPNNQVLTSKNTNVETPQKKSLLDLSASLLFGYNGVVQKISVEKQVKPKSFKRRKKKTNDSEHSVDTA